MAKPILVADLLCGAGGSSTGCKLALTSLGLRMVLTCLNHWPTAIETHTKNHPEARHYCQDISTVRPHLVVPEGYLDLLMASPTCTHHSRARGGKPTSDQQRSDPWHIVTWLTELRVKRIIIENVREFVDWGPVDTRTGKPIKSRKGEYFRAWIDTLKRLGFEVEWRILNAADYGDATTRQRFILMGRGDGKPIVWPQPTHMRQPSEGLALFPTMKKWKAAREIIDWSIRGKSIFARPIPLAPKTLLRIGAGAIKFNWPQGFIARLEPEMVRSLQYVIRSSFGARHDQKTKAKRAKCRQRAQQAIHWLRRIRRDGSAFASGLMSAKHADPMIVTMRRNAAAQSVGVPTPTITANGKHIGLAEPVLVNMKGRSTASSVDTPMPTQTAHAPHQYVAEPVIMNGRKGNQAKPVGTEPIPTLDTKGGVWLAEPMVLSQHNSGAPRSTEDPLPTITTGGAASEERPGCARPMLVEPFLLNRHGDNGSTRAHDIGDPTPTADCRGAGYVVEPFVLSQASGGAPRGTDDPVPTIPTDGAHALIAPYYSSGSGETCQSDETPLPTITTKGRLSMVVPITHSDGSNRARDAAEQPLPTLTTAHRGELAFITASFGEREGQAPRIHDADAPMPTICATGGSTNLIEPTQDYDILFRMLEPHELAAAMGFIGADVQYEFAGTKTDQIKQIGNAVSVAKMRACVGAIMADAAPKAKMPLDAATPRSEVA